MARALSLRRIRALPIRAADMLLVGILIAVVMLMIVPIPPLAMDVLIAVNMTIGILLLLSSLYVTKPLDFSTFPTVLLLSTLFRLAISISTTRMILTHMDAGDIVQQFGEMVAGGNLVVGLVVFLIITIVQFIVISKGAERVAEVAARFSLDAMPGKQLSIDSDLRSGILSKDEAREKRRTLELESKLHGSLDGAMKFVKGDAIASIVIVLVNLIGGLAVGTLYHDMSAGEAAATFSILTIGDGLVAQVPALFSAMAAGLLVTRTTDEERDRDLGPAIARQISGKPHVLMIAGGLAVLLGLVPGFPTIVFFGLAALLFGGGALSHPTSGAWIRGKFGIEAASDTAIVGEALIEARALPTLDALRLTVGLPAESAEFQALAARVRTGVAALQERSGVAIPDLRIVADADIGEQRWVLAAHDAPLGSGKAEGADPVATIGLYVEQLLGRNLVLFLGLQEVTDQLNRLGESHPEVVKEAVRAVPTGRIGEVLRLLAEERVPLRNFRDAVEAIGEVGQYEREAVAMAERVRVAMRRHLIAPLCDEGRLRVLIVGTNLEDIIRQTLTPVDGQMRLAINPHQMRALNTLLAEQIAASGARAILTAQDLRRPLRLLIAGDLFEVPVISFNELNPAVPLDIVGELNSAPESLASQAQDEFAL
ncbi:flagellar biosynthesis protein FlhA [Sphingosinicella sp. BN140058]|uniref:flagellar biosynthesis protein FlhA n=1 Tax=Sphingosinicella sp. BN140058 TaxID=1892855 RepID=UPI001010228C|nr:flagellar biosynthesis protein FlhA [Sphingosinicella sp. BN140058]QAY75574.1 type III secretion pore protein [Sphingosinicella sp. BN140058]